jgi:hypothetical protein
VNDPDSHETLCVLTDEESRAVNTRTVPDGQAARRPQRPIRGV